ncbi:MAG: hypothetical protein M3404_00600 [Actinomycetota bacterium]|nr:hypothetical protein [Actinomycetota bacterium]
MRRTIFYAGESLTSAHASFESLKAYVFEDDDGTIGIVHEPEDNSMSYGRLVVAVVLTLLLAKWTWERAGLDSRPFDEIEGIGDLAHGIEEADPAECPLRRRRLPRQVGKCSIRYSARLHGMARRDSRVRK